MDGYGYTPIPPAEASCIIAHLFVELAPPCSCCKREDGVIVSGGCWLGFFGFGRRSLACHTGRWRSGTTPRAGC